MARNTRTVPDERRGTIGAAMKRFREAAGLTQDEAAIRMGVDQTHWARWERGAYKPSRRSLERIAQALGVGVVNLTG